MRVLLVPLALLGLACSAGRPSPSKLLEAARPEEAKVVRAMNQFALDLYPSAKGADPNAVFSPASIYWALLLLEPGARGRSADQLHQVLHAPFTGDALHAEASALAAGLKRSDVATLRIANGLFGQPKFPFDPKFIAAGRERYGAELQNLDFENDAANARLFINDWVLKQTNAKIPELLPSGTPSSDTRLMLVNAVYFLATWAHQFSVSATVPADFTLTDGTKLKTPMMRNTAHWHYGEEGPVRVLELTYRGSDVVFDILLPKDVQGLADVEAALDVEKLDTWLGDLKSTEVNLQLPRFTVRSKVPSLSGALVSLGLKDLFDTAAVDLSGIAGKKGDLVVSSVVHQAFIEVNEKGTEAAAATAIDVVLTSAQYPPPPPPINFHVDRPFMFLLRDSKTQQILFVGRVAKPEAPPAPKDD